MRKSQAEKIQEKYRVRQGVAEYLSLTDPSGDSDYFKIRKNFLRETCFSEEEYERSIECLNDIMGGNGKLK